MEIPINSAASTSSETPKIPLEDALEMSLGNYYY